MADPPYPFSDNQDEAKCLRFLLSKVKTWRGDLADEGHISEKDWEETTDFEGPGDALSDLEDISKYCDHRFEELEDEERKEAFDAEAWATTWDTFEAVSQLMSEPVTLLDWRLDSAEFLDFGYSDVLTRTMIFEGGTTVNHEYSEIPPSLRWTISKIEQKGATFYISSAKVCEIDATCSVPSLPENISSSEAGQRVLDPNLGDDEWQRRLAPKRLNSIRTFIEKSNNIIANTPLLFIRPDAEGVSINADQNELTVDFEQFLLKLPSGSYYDALHDIEDYRPIWLIDGQHRVRGMSRSEIGKDLYVPIIIFPSDLSLSEAAKIFAEINTLQEGLTNLHTLFMQHRFHIPSPKAKRDFSPREWDDDEPSTHNSRANHLIYEAAGYLASHEGGPLYNRIRILDQNPQNIPVVKADQWVDFGRSWFLKNGPYHPGCGMTQEQMNEEIENYFKAFIETCNHDDWEDERKRWSPHSRNKGLLQKNTEFQALIRVFPTVWEKAVGPNVPTPIPVSVFKEALNPLKWVDWLHPSIKDAFGGGGEKGRSAIRIWMEDAIRNGEQFEHDDVMSDRIKAEPGKGIRAPPGKPKLTIEGDVKWPSKGKNVRMVSTRPANCLLTSYWDLVDSDGAGRTEDLTKLAKPDRNRAVFEIRHQKWMDDMDYIDVNVAWRNAASPPTGTDKKRLKNPNR